MTTHVPDELMEKNVADRKEVEKDVFAPFNILFLSRVEEAKGIRETLQAYQIAKERRPAITLTCAGGGEELAYWKDFSAQHGIDAFFCGHLAGEAKVGAFASADCYVLLSYSEGMPTSVLEAMAAGVPVIVRATGGLVDMFESEKMGYISPDLDPNIYAQFIVELVDDRRRVVEMGRFNQQYVKQNALSSVIAKRLDFIFCETSKC